MRNTPEDFIARHTLNAHRFKFLIHTELYCEGLYKVVIVLSFFEFNERIHDRISTAYILSKSKIQELNDLLLGEQLMRI